jgi:uncharacterized protein
MRGKNIKVIFDTNVWISFLIGKRLSSIKEHISARQIKIIISAELLAEIRDVTGRERMRKYFPAESVNNLIEFLETIAEMIVPKSNHTICRDPKDNFLLDLIEASKADYLITGDKDLLVHNPFKTATILTPANFEKIISGN